MSNGTGSCDNNNEQNGGSSKDGKYINLYFQIQIKVMEVTNNQKKKELSLYDYNMFFLFTLKLYSSDVL